MKLILTLAALTTLAIPTCGADTSACSDPAIASKGKISAAKCSCMIKNANKYLSSADTAYLLDYWSGKRRDAPSQYFAKAYPSGKNKPLIKYSAANAGLCK